MGKRVLSERTLNSSPEEWELFLRDKKPSTAARYQRARNQYLDERAKKDFWGEPERLDREKKIQVSGEEYRFVHVAEVNLEWGQKAFIKWSSPNKHVSDREMAEIKQYVRNHQYPGMAVSGFHIVLTRDQATGRKIYAT
jgi:hypothetical protein